MSTTTVRTRFSCVSYLKWLEVILRGVVVKLVQVTLDAETRSPAAVLRGISRRRRWRRRTVRRGRQDGRRQLLRRWRRRRRRPSTVVRLPTSRSVAVVAVPERRRSRRRRRRRRCQPAGHVETHAVRVGRRPLVVAVHQYALGQYALGQHALGQHCLALGDRRGPAVRRHRTRADHGARRHRRQLAVVVGRHGTDWHDHATEIDKDTVALCFKLR